MQYSETVMRIKAIAWVLDKKVYEMDNEVLASIIRQAKAGQWDMVWDTFRKSA